MTTELLKQALSLLSSIPDDRSEVRFTLGPTTDALCNLLRAALSQPASEDAWIKDADTYAEALGLAYYLATLAKDSFTSGFSTDQELLDAQKNVANHKQRLFAHLRARPAPEGFVSVPVEPTEAMIAAYLKDQPSGEA